MEILLRHSVTCPGPFRDDWMETNHFCIWRRQGAKRHNLFNGLMFPLVPSRLRLQFQRSRPLQELNQFKPFQLNNRARGTNPSFPPQLALLTANSAISCHPWAADSLTTSQSISNITRVHWCCCSPCRVSDERTQELHAAFYHLSLSRSLPGLR